MTPAALVRLILTDRPDGELLAAFVSDRDEGAFAELVRRHGPLVWGVCRRILSHPADADDAFQASFLVLVRRAHRLTSSNAIGPWLHRVAVLTARDQRKKAARRRARLQPLPPDLPAPSVPPSDVDDLLLGLPDRYRAAVVLCCLEGLTQRAAAERLGVPEGTLSARLSRGLAKLRTRFAGTLPAVAAVPLALSESTVKAATSLHLAAAVSPGVLHLTEGVLRMLWLKKAAAVAGCVVLVVGLGIGLGAGGRPATADDNPQPDPVKKATAELDKRIVQLKQLQNDLERKKAELEVEYKKAAEWQAAEIKRLEEAKRSLTGRPLGVAASTTLVLSVGGPEAVPPFTVLEKRAADAIDLSTEVYSEAALRRHLTRLKSDPKCPTTITLDARKDAPMDRLNAAVEAVKAAGFGHVRVGAADSPEARLLAIKREMLALEARKLDDDLAFQAQMVKKGFAPQTRADEAKLKLAELQIKLKQLDAEAATTDPVIPDRPGSYTMKVGDRLQVALDAKLVAVRTANPQTIVDAQADPKMPEVLQVRALRSGTVKLSLQLAAGPDQLVIVTVTE